MASEFDFELKNITKMFGLVGFTRNVTGNTSKYFNKGKDDFLVPEWVLDERKLIILQLPLSECKFNIVWNAGNIRSLFQMKR